MDSRFVESGSTWYTSPIAGEQEVTLKGGVAGLGAGKLFYTRIANTTGAAIFIFLFDGTNADGPLCPPVPVPANGQTELQFPYPMQFVNGLTIGASTGQAGYVAAGANSMQAHALFK